MADFFDVGSKVVGVLGFGLGLWNAWLYWNRLRHTDALSIVDIELELKELELREHKARREKEKDTEFFLDAHKKKIISMLTDLSARGLLESSIKNDRTMELERERDLMIRTGGEQSRGSASGNRDQKRRTRSKTRNPEKKDSILATP